MIHMTHFISTIGGRGMSKSLRDPRLALHVAPFPSPRPGIDPSQTGSERSDVGAGEPKHRRLAAILAADVAGYSRLVGADEMGTLTRLQEHWDAVVEPTIRSPDVRLWRVAGDG